jgi:hypothetical protein
LRANPVDFVVGDVVVVTTHQDRVVRSIVQTIMKRLVATPSMPIADDRFGKSAVVVNITVLHHVSSGLKGLAIPLHSP